MDSSLEEALGKAAHAADRAVKATMQKYANGLVTDEDDITGALIGRLDSAFDENIGGIAWSSSILRHRRGIASQESQAGADMLIHVSIETPQLTYSKGILIQSKRIDDGAAMTVSAHNELLRQCKKMQGITPASFVFNYTKTKMRCASAMKISGSSSRTLSDSCNLTSYRFFFELFRCTIGDPKITSAKFEGLQIPQGISLTGTVGK